MEYYERWLGIYNKEKFAEGEYLNLYDIAFDKPETHLIKRGKTFYYSFFTNGRFDGSVELRGLEKGEYEASDIYSCKVLSTFTSDAPVVHIHFDRYMIVKVRSYLKNPQKCHSERSEAGEESMTIMHRESTRLQCRGCFSRCFAAGSA